jgi:UDP-N-acetyl-2-amino-2-deoxyglucuronate dehydrogenase
MKKFTLIGAAGYIAPRHLKAIKQTENILCAACDSHDSVGILDSYFPQTDFFTSFERFERYIAKQNSNHETHLDYLTICSPNFLHDTHVRLGLLNGMNVICEKPLVLFPSNLDLLEKIEEQSGKKVNTIMQLRYHPELIKLKNKLDSNENSKRHSVDLKYITPRGNWYHNSWKGDVEKSGGISTNIGIHLFDLLIWLYGEVSNYKILQSEESKMRGTLELKNADVNWFLSIDRNDLPEEALANNKVSFRSLKADGENIEFSDGFTDLHTKVYQEILEGRGLGIKDAWPSIELVYKLRNIK